MTGETEGAQVLPPAVERPSWIRRLKRWNFEWGRALELLADLWGGRFPPRRLHGPSVLERLFLTPVLLGRLAALSNWQAFFERGQRVSRTFVEIYLLLWVTLLSALLFVDRARCQDRLMKPTERIHRQRLAGPGWKVHLTDCVARINPSDTPDSGGAV